MISISIKVFLLQKIAKQVLTEFFLLLKKSKFRFFFVNVQGDEPLILPKDIKKIIDAKKRYKNHVICGYTLINYKEAINNNVPKVVVNNKSNLIYMSRSLVPGVKK